MLEALINYLPYLYCYSVTESILNYQGEYFVGQPREIWIVSNQELSG